MAYKTRYGLPITIKDVNKLLRDFKTGLRFNGNDDYVSFGNINPFGETFYVIIRAIWFGVNGEYQHIMAKRDSYGTSTMMFDLYLRDTDGAIGQDTGSAALQSSDAMPVNYPSTIAYVHDGRDKLYLNNQLLVDTTHRNMGTGTDAEFVIGAVDTPKKEAFNGILDELIIGVGNPTWKDIVAMTSKYKYDSDEDSEGEYNKVMVVKMDEISGNYIVDEGENGFEGEIHGAKFTSKTYMKVSVDGAPVLQTPDTINDLMVHYAADQNVYNDAGTTLAANGDRVQQWNDQSGNAFNLAQATAGIKPQYVEDAINGKPALLFSNSRKDVLSVADAAKLSPTRKVHMFAVIKPTTILSGVAGIVCKEGVGGITNPSYGMWLNNGKIHGNFTSSGNSNGGTSLNLGATANGNYIVEASLDGINLKSYQNGELSNAVANINDMADTTGDLRIGAQKAVFDTRSFDGYVAEIIIYDRVLSLSERKGIEQYLSEKYQIELTA